MAITVEFGKCAQCNENNPKQLQMCRKCNAPLPWAKMPKPKISKAPASVQRPALNNTAGGLDWGTFGVGLISFLMPIIGYFLHRSYTDSGDQKAGVALIGSILGVLGHVARVALRSAT